LFEAKKRFGLCVLNYVITSNHVHVLIRDTGKGVIAQSIQLAAGRTAQEFNQRKDRKGAFWEDRYHATAVEGDIHLHHCLVYIDLNMVRAGVVRHPGEWEYGGYTEIQQPPRRYGLIDVPKLSTLCGFSAVAEFQAAYRRWVAQSLASDLPQRDGRWSESVAVGRRAFVEQVRRELGLTSQSPGIGTLCEAEGTYTVNFHWKTRALRPKDTSDRMKIRVQANG
jgi:putative transposase